MKDIYGSDPEDKLQLYGFILSGLKTLNEKLISTFALIAMLMAAVMTAVILVQVFFRYFLSNALPWPEEAARFMMVWMTFLVLPYGYHKKMNVNVEFLVERFGEKSKTVFEGFTHILVCVLSLYLLKQGIDMTLRGNLIGASSLPINMSLVYGVLPVSFLSLFLVALEKLMSRQEKGAE